MRTLDQPQHPSDGGGSYTTDGTTLSAEGVPKRQKPPKFIFVAHYVEPHNPLYNDFPLLLREPERVDEFWMRKLLSYPASIGYLFGSEAVDVVDRYQFTMRDTLGTLPPRSLTGETWLVRNFAYHYLFKWGRESMRRRALAAIMRARDMGVGVVGEGALIKDEGLSRGGQFYIDALKGDMGDTALVHGDTATANVLVFQTFKLLRLFGLGDQPVLMIGMTSKIGRVVALRLVRMGVSVFGLTRHTERFSKIKAEAGSAGGLLKQVTSIREVREVAQHCRMWITCKAEPRGMKLLRHIPPDAVVLNCSVPDPLTPALLKTRPDIFHFDGGLVAYNPAMTTLKFTMRLKPGLTYACHAGTIAHCLAGWKHHEVGQVDLGAMEEVRQAVLRAGFTLPPWTSFLQPVNLK